MSQLPPMEDNTKPLRGLKRTSVTAVEQNKSGRSTVSSKKVKLTLVQLLRAAKRPSIVVIVAPPGAGKTTLLKSFEKVNVLYREADLAPIWLRDADDYHDVAKVYQHMRDTYGSGWWARPHEAIFRHPMMEEALRSLFGDTLKHLTLAYSTKRPVMRDAIIVTAETRILALFKELDDDGRADVLFVPWLPPADQHAANMTSRLSGGERGPVWLGADLDRNRDYFFHQYIGFTKRADAYMLRHVAYTNSAYEVAERYRSCEMLYQLVLSWLEDKRRKRAVSATDYHISKCEKMAGAKEREHARLLRSYEAKRQAKAERQVDDGHGSPTDQGDVTG